MEPKMFVSTSVNQQTQNISFQNSQESIEFVVQYKNRVNCGKPNPRSESGNTTKSVSSQSRITFEYEKFNNFIESYENKTKMRRSFGDMVYFNFKPNQSGNPNCKKELPYEEFLQTTNKGKAVIKEKDPEVIPFPRTNYQEEKNKRVLLDIKKEQPNKENPGASKNNGLTNSDPKLQAGIFEYKRVYSICKTKTNGPKTPSKTTKSLPRSFGSTSTIQKLTKNHQNESTGETRRNISFVNIKRKKMELDSLILRKI